MHNQRTKTNWSNKDFEEFKDIAQSLCNLKDLKDLALVFYRWSRLKDPGCQKMVRSLQTLTSLETINLTFDEYIIIQDNNGFKSIFQTLEKLICF